MKLSFLIPALALASPVPAVEESKSIDSGFDQPPIEIYIPDWLIELAEQKVAADEQPAHRVERSVKPGLQFPVGERLK